MIKLTLVPKNDYLGSQKQLIVNILFHFKETVVENFKK
jgi:hypothetical protein